MRSSLIHGTEYELAGGNLFDVSGNHDNNVPCSLCQAKGRATMIMIPAKLTCPDSSWTLEYTGFIMSAASWGEYRNYRSMYECVDRGAEGVPGSQDNMNGATFHYASAYCNTFLHCPPYENQIALSCVVCSK